MGKISYNWHLNNKPDVFNITKGECFLCGDICHSISDGCVHHHTYKPVDNKSVYDYCGKDALNLGIVDWCCNDCHEKIHQNTSIDNNTRVLEKCYICKKKYGDYDRSKTIGLDRPICRKCYKSYKKLRNIEISGQMTLFGYNS